MMQRVLHIDQQAFGAEVHLVRLRGPDQMVAGAVHVAHDVVVAAVVVAQVGIVGIQVEPFVDLVLGFVPGVDVGEFADAADVVLRNVEPVALLRRGGGSGRSEEQGRERPDQQQIMMSFSFHCRLV